MSPSGWQDTVSTSHAAFSVAAVTPALTPATSQPQSPHRSPRQGQMGRMQRTPPRANHQLQQTQPSRQPQPQQMWQGQQPKSQREGHEQSSSVAAWDSVPRAAGVGMAASEKATVGAGLDETGRAVRMTAEDVRRERAAFFAEFERERQQLAEDAELARAREAELAELMARQGRADFGEVRPEPTRRQPTSPSPAIDGPATGGQTIAADTARLSSSAVETEKAGKTDARAAQRAPHELQGWEMGRRGRSERSRLQQQQQHEFWSESLPQQPAPDVKSSAAVAPFATRLTGHEHAQELQVLSPRLL
jgi:hypothetical protein